MFLCTVRRGDSGHAGQSPDSPPLTVLLYLFPTASVYNYDTELKFLNHYFANFEDVLLAYEHFVIQLHTFVWVRCTNIEIEKEEKSTTLMNTKIQEFQQTNILSNDYKVKWNNSGTVNVKYIKTTPGRILLNEIFQ